MTTWQDISDRWGASQDEEAGDSERVKREWAEREALIRQAESRSLQMARGEFFRGLALPQLAWEVCQYGAKETPALAVMRGEPCDLLVISGGVGTGKTVAAVEWLRAWIFDAANWQVGPWGASARGRLKFTSAFDLAHGPKYDQRWIRDHTHATRLVVDDLGAEFSDEKGNFASLLDAIVDARYQAKRPTLITTNLDAAGFRARYGARVADRIRERGRFESVGSKSLRGKK